VKHRKLQELLENQVLSVSWVPTKDQVADVLTKQLPKPQFEHLRNMLHVLPKSEWESSCVCLSLEMKCWMRGSVRICACYVCKLHGMHALHVYLMVL
jgi:hypothetical protein